MKKTIKKLAAVFMIAVICLCAFTACSSVPAEIVGTWKVEKAFIDSIGVEIDIVNEDLQIYEDAGLGGTITQLKTKRLNFKYDGTCTTSGIFDSVGPYPFEVDGTELSVNEKQIGTFTASQIVIEMDDSILYFIKEY